MCVCEDASPREMSWCDATVLWLVMLRFALVLRFRWQTPYPINKCITAYCAMIESERKVGTDQQQTALCVRAVCVPCIDSEKVKMKWGGGIQFYHRPLQGKEKGKEQKKKGGEEKKIKSPQENCSKSFPRPPSSDEINASTLGRGRQSIRRGPTQNSGPRQGLCGPCHMRPRRHRGSRAERHAHPPPLPPPLPPF